jgi:hypothetical protein
MSVLSITEVIHWLREKATELNKTADSLEQIMGSHGLVGGLVQSSHLPPVDINVSDIVRVLRSKGSARAYDVAKALQTTKERVSAIVKSNPEAFEIRQRGWIKVHANGS